MLFFRVTASPNEALHSRPTGCRLAYLAVCGGDRSLTWGVAGFEARDHAFEVSPFADGRRSMLDGG